MRLTKYSDFALRTLMYVALAKRRCTIDEIVDRYGMPKNHLIKVVNHLANLGYVASIRGKGGGIELADTPENINIGEVVRSTEQSFDLVECFSAEDDQCILSRHCKLATVLETALENFLATLDEYCLQDITTPKVSVILKLNK